MGEIPVWCDLPEEVPATIDAMVIAWRNQPRGARALRFLGFGHIPAWDTRGEARRSRLKKRRLQERHEKRPAGVTPPTFLLRLSARLSGSAAFPSRNNIAIASSQRTFLR
jgi:hypothetical protein